MPSNNQQQMPWRRVVGIPILACALADFFPTYGPPWFRYTGSDPAIEVWNLGWPLVLMIYDPRSGIHIFPFLNVVVLAHVAVISFIGLTVALVIRCSRALLAARRAGQLTSQ